MADKDHDGLDTAKRQDAYASKKEVGHLGNAYADPTGEAIARLDIACEQFDAKARTLITRDDKASRQAVIDELLRIRNTLVVLEKSASQFVIEEVLAVLREDKTAIADTDELARILLSAVKYLGRHLRQIHYGADEDNALALVPLVNDCRAYRDMILLSDVLMLAAGVELPASEQVSESKKKWTDQRVIWTQYATFNHMNLVQRLLHWWREERVGSVGPLLRQLDRFSELSDKHDHLNSLTPLFQAASVVAKAVSEGQIDDGPALRGLYAQLERNVQRCALVAAPEDLVPGDLLRNFLYYAAHIESESAPSVNLRRRFRLDRVRQIEQQAYTLNTPTIGVVYQLTNAIRHGVIRETKPLRAWLDEPDTSQLPPKLVRLRVRLTQLEPVLTIIGATGPLDMLKSINAELDFLKSEGVADAATRTKLAQSLLQLDSLLDQSARRSVVKNRNEKFDPVQIQDIYLDVATDDCLREARNQMQTLAMQLLPRIAELDIDSQACMQMVSKLDTVNYAVQMLPLPEITHLFNSLRLIINRLTVAERQTISPAINLDRDRLHKMLTELFACIDDYLACVLLPEAGADQFSGNIAEVLENINNELVRQADVSGGRYKQETPVVTSQTMPTELGGQAMGVSEDELASSESAIEELSLSGEGSLTLNVDDDLLLKATGAEEHANPDGTTEQLDFQSECLGYLESLDESVRLALKPSENLKANLPNENMLRALHMLAGNAQAVSASEVLGIVLPLQRASLTMHRQGRYFDASQARYIGDLVVALRARLHSINTGDAVSESVKITEASLNEFISTSVLSVEETKQEVAVVLGIGSQVKSLDEVFFEEASEILDKLRLLIRVASFEGSSLSEALGLLHTLKGSARMAGKLSISECAHDLESSLQAKSLTELPRDLLKDGYRALHGKILQSSFRRTLCATDKFSAQLVSDRTSIELKRRTIATGADNLLDLATDLAVNQARLGEELKRLNDVCRDMGATSFRWRDLLQQGDMPDSPAVTEMLADIEAVRLVMRDALHQAQREQQQASRVSASLQQSLVRSRLCRVDQIQERLSDTIADMASACGVAAQLEFSGGDIMIDKDLLRSLTAPLEHLVRNCVIHGIETAEQRLAKNKPTTGVISLTVSIDGGELVLRLDDDGCGVNYKTLNRVLKGKGETGINTSEQLHSVLFKEGFSSISKADAIAGHGLGLSVVKTAVERMQGRIGLLSTENAGFQITLRIPQDTIVKQIVLVQNNERFYGIPVVYVKSVQLDGPEISTDQTLSSDKLRVTSFQHLLGEPEMQSTVSGPKPSVSTAVGNQSLEIEIDEIIGYREVLTQPLGAQLASLEKFSDGCILPAGQQVLILNLPALMKRPHDDEPVLARKTTVPYRPTVLIVDDSHTTRNTMQQTLLQWGLEVRQSKDGLDALESLASYLPDIMIIDLEMPRLDGFGLLRKIAENYSDEHLPMIVVSHHDDAKKRALAASLGAVSYLVKPYLEAELQEAIVAAGLLLADLTIA